MDKLNQYIILKSNRKLGFAEFGNSNGYPIIYCHGSQSSRLEMHYDVSFAIDNNLRIVTIDRPGHGLSDFNPQGTILSFGTDVKELTEHLKIDRFSVVGMSAGAPFALGLAYLFPTKISQTAIISGFAPYNENSKQHLSKEVKAMLKLAKSFPFLLKVMLNIQSKQLKSKPKKALQNFLKIMSEPDQQILKSESVKKVIENMFKESFSNGSKGITYEISKILVQDWGFELNKIETPVAFWQGNKDNNVPHQWAALMKNEIPNATLNTISDKGHLLIFEYANEIFSNLNESKT